MNRLLTTSCLVGGVAFLGGSMAHAQQVPPCPFPSAVDTTRLASISDTARIYLKGGFAYSKVTDDKLNGFYSFDFYRRWTDPDAGLYNYPKERVGYERGGFLAGLKEGPWKCVRYVPTQTAWWECYRLGQLVSSTAPPLAPEKGPRKRKVPRRSVGAVGKKSGTIPRPRL